MKKILLLIGVLSLSLNAGLGSAVVNAASRHKTKEYNKGVEAYNQALAELRNNNNKKASELFAKACDKKVYDGCWSAGVLLEEFNVLQSAIYYKKSCDNEGKCLLQEDKIQVSTTSVETVKDAVNTSVTIIPSCSEAVTTVEELLNENSTLGMIGQASDIQVKLDTVRESSLTGTVRTCKADLDLGLDERQKKMLETNSALKMSFGNSAVSYTISMTDDGKSFYVDILQ